MKRSHPVEEREETHIGICLFSLYVSLTLLIKSVPKGSRYNTFITYCDYSNSGKFAFLKLLPQHRFFIEIELYAVSDLSSLFYKKNSLFKVHYLNSLWRSSKSKEISFRNLKVFGWQY